MVNIIVIIINSMLSSRHSLLSWKQWVYFQVRSDPLPIHSFCSYKWHQIPPSLWNVHDTTDKMLNTPITKTKLSLWNIKPRIWTMIKTPYADIAEVTMVLQKYQDGKLGSRLTKWLQCNLSQVTMLLHCICIFILRSSLGTSQSFFLSPGDVFTCTLILND